MTQPLTFKRPDTGSRPVRFAALLGAAALTALSVLLAPAPVATGNELEAAPTVIQTVPTMIVLDASGSMKTDDAPGPRIEAAKAAVTGLISTLPTGAPVGLQVYGTSTGSTDAEKAAGCADIKTLVPVAPLDPAAMTAAVDSIEASGYTPIGQALRAAAEALPNEGPRSIVLVSDGEDTCAPPTPCDVAKELKQTGVELTVHTVGFKVDQVARDQLACIAESTGGSYSDAVDAVQLDNALTARVQDALAGYTAQGVPVVGADQLDPAAPLLVPGQYTDTMTVGETDQQPGTTKYYRVPVYEGARPYISVTTVLPTDEDIEGWAMVGSDLSLLDAAGEQCAQVDFPRSQLGYGNYETPTVSLSWEVAGNRCVDSDTLFLRVERTGEAYSARDLQVEISVRIEPPADATGLPEPAEEGSDLPAPVLGEAAPVVGGRSFNDAPLLADAATYTDTLSTGESRYYRVRVDWGQRLVYQIKHTGPASPVLTNGAAADISLYNPVRRMVGNGETLWMFNKKNETVVKSTDLAVRYNNRESGSKSSLSLDGEYYLVITADRPNGAVKASTTSFTFTTAVSGQVDPAPEYLVPGRPTSNDEPTTTPGQTPTAATSSAPESDEETGAGGFAADKATNTSSDSAPNDNSSDVVNSAPTLRAAEADSNPLNLLWWLTGGLVVLAVVGGGIALSTSRSRHKRQPGAQR